MALIDFNERQLTLKVVYYGPPRSGKTTNLRHIHERVAELNRGRLMILDTSDDRTLFFDLLPIFFRTSSLSCRIKVYTVPGQPMHEATRRVVLRGADSVVFVADSLRSKEVENRGAYQNLLENLDRVGFDAANFPIILQYNKRDLDDVIPEAELERFGGHRLRTASAVRGEGVMETFYELLELTWASADERFGLEGRFGMKRPAFNETLRSHLEGDA